MDIKADIFAFFFVGLTDFIFDCIVLCHNKFPFSLQLFFELVCLLLMYSLYTFYCLVSIDILHKIYCFLLCSFTCQRFIIILILDCNICCCLRHCKRSSLFLSVCFPLPYTYIILLYLYLFNSLFIQTYFNFIVYFYHRTDKKKRLVFLRPQPLKSFYTYNVIIQKHFFCVIVFFLSDRFHKSIFIIQSYNLFHIFLTRKTYNVTGAFVYAFYIRCYAYYSSFSIASKADKMLSISSRRT